MNGMSVNDDLGGMWKEAVVVYVNGLRKTMINLSNTVGLGIGI